MGACANCGTLVDGRMTVCPRCGYGVAPPTAQPAAPQAYPYAHPAAQPTLGQARPAPPRRSLTKIIVLVTIAGIVMMLAVMAPVVFLLEGRSEDHLIAERAVLSHPTITGSVGEPAKASWPCWSTALTTGGRKYGVHRFDVAGPRGEGSVVATIHIAGLAGTASRHYVVESIEWDFGGKASRLSSENPSP